VTPGSNASAIELSQAMPMEMEMEQQEGNWADAYMPESTCCCLPIKIGYKALFGVALVFIFVGPIMIIADTQIMEEERDYLNAVIKVEKVNDTIESSPNESKLIGVYIIYVVSILFNTLYTLSAINTVCRLGNWLRG
jgi:hypothetical protein